MNRRRYHRLNRDRNVMEGFSRTLPEIEWLSLVLILFYLVVGAQETAKPQLILASSIFTVLILAFQYINFFSESREWKISIQTWLMIFYISFVILHTGKLDSPLFGLYLLPIIASAITLSKVTTFLSTGLIGVIALYFQSAEAMDSPFFPFAEDGKLLIRFFPLLLVAYITTMLSADIQSKIP